MGKLSFAGILLLCSVFTKGGDVPKPSLSIKPNPLHAGEVGVIRGPAGTVVKLDWDPPGAGPATITLDEQGKGTFTTPQGTGDVIAEADGCEGTAATWGP